ncbi:DNA-binding response regulator [Cellvibrio zantedeschiae]|uniref:DNA-binding response regulator n=1 Tax=Cellvibrio zantedeschiae TaxID=1237077 RepID=A0ABQ3B3L3_9GAMM|nr:LytTR family DNA-binding domain-containing protein [Cellvibrio zantedeschiae]GGY76641.1 DNA-binding response regulator [Cellvibrio zantedeschiae]
MNILIVDDSRLARKELVELTSSIPGINIVAEASDVASAVAAINQHKPDLVLLDIHLPDGDGFDVLENIDHVPQVIFTTAYEQHAVRAFEFNALDYLLKPIEQDRLTPAIERCVKKLQRIEPVPEIKSPKSRSDQIFVRDGDHCHFIRLSDLRLVNVEGNYVRLFFLDKKTMLARSMSYVEERLDPSVFFRANRQQIINMDYVASIEQWINEGLMVKMQDGTEVEVSRRQAKELKQRLDF